MDRLETSAVAAGGDSGALTLLDWSATAERELREELGSGGAARLCGAGMRVVAR